MKSQAQDKSAINRMLGTHGLPPLESGPGLMAAFGYLVEDHEHLRTLLVRCEPENRRAMYDSLTPYMRFSAKPLDSYIAESAAKAEAQKLPTMEPDGSLKWPTVAPTAAGISASQDAMASLLGVAQSAVTETFAKHRLVVTCRSCTKEQTFVGDTKADAIHHARVEGWVYYEHEGVAREICPDCPAVRKAS